jgi:hypothetical protein
VPAVKVLEERWRTVGRVGFVADDELGIIGQMHHDLPGFMDRARLMAAAPEMARALLEIRAVACEEDVDSIDAILRRAGVIS